MNLEQLVQQQWAAFLKVAINTDRQAHPTDERSDKELAEVILKRLHKKGVIQKNPEGKYILPRLVDGKLPDKSAKGS